MKAVLSCEIPVSRIAVFAEMARLERRPELGLLCKAAHAQGQRISVATVQAALPGLPDAGANNVIAWCRTLGLCDQHGGLTALGEDVAESNEAPVPEQGVYRLWLAEHPLIGRRVLAVDPLASRNDPRFDNIQPLPVEPERGKVFRSVVKSNERFVVRDLPTNHGQRGCLVEQTHATCQLRWTLDFDAERDHWQLEGSIEVPHGNGKYAMRPMQHEPEKDGLDLWKLMELWGRGPLRDFGLWNAEERRLAATFQGLAEGEIETFRKTLTLRHAEVLGKGMYDNVPLEDVPIGPYSAADAQQWAMARFDRSVVKKPAYRSRAEVRARFAELTEGTPLEEYSPTLPAHEDLLRTHEKDLASFWAFAAPVDLAPHPVGHDELAAMRIGSQAPSTTSSEPPGVVRVRYRCGWSMRQLVDRLLAGTIPRKVLLCDRYVRGADNLATLRLLVQAERAIAPSVAFEVWTGDDDPDFKQIQPITGSKPRSYRDVFGKNVPHDRYLLVLPSQGQGFGWHMTNSPLHARSDLPSATPESPLRWKDLAGTRVSVEELEPMLRQWFNQSGGGQ